MSTMEKTTKPKQKTEQIYIVYLIENKLIKEKIKNIFKLHTKIIIINQQNEPLKYIRQTDLDGQMISSMYLLYKKYG